MLHPLIAQPEEDIRENYLLMFTLSFIYTLLQVGDFYYFSALTDPYRSYQIIHVSLDTWLFVNGFIGLCTALYFSLYIYFLKVRLNYSKHIIRLFYVIGSVWTIFGYFFVDFAYLGNYSGFMSYFVMKFIIQTSIYLFSWNALFL